jgi:uncharacterized protein YrrD
MLLLGSRLNATPVMSLQTGTRLAQTAKAVIDPSNLRIVAYEVDGPLLTERPMFIRTADIREYGRLGMIIDSNDELIGLDDVIQIEKLYELGFPLIGMAVIDDHKRKLGKVSDYTLETDGFVVQQLNINRGFFKGLNDTGLLVHRSQIVEINDKAIVVRSATIKTVEPVMQSIRGEFVNPFRKPSHPEVEASVTHE